MDFFPFHIDSRFVSYFNSPIKLLFTSLSSPLYLLSLFNSMMQSFPTELLTIEGASVAMGISNFVVNEAIGYGMASTLLSLFLYLIYKMGSEFISFCRNKLHIFTFWKEMSLPTELINSKTIQIVNLLLNYKFDRDVATKALTYVSTQFKSVAEFFKTCTVPLLITFCGSYISLNWIQNQIYPPNYILNTDNSKIFINNTSTILKYNSNTNKWIIIY